MKSDVDKLDIDQLKNAPSGLSCVKTKVDKLDLGTLVHAPVDLSKLRVAVKMMLLKKDVSNAKIRSKEDKIPDITKVATNASPNAKINEVKAEIRSNTN